MMRHLLTILALTGVLTCAADTQVHWISTEHDFGAFYESVGRVTTIFRAVNTGSEPVSILSVRANCGCTAADISADVIQPGDTLKITATYNAENRPGPFEKAITVDLTDGIKQRLIITGRVVGDNPSLKRSYHVDCGTFRIKQSRYDFGFMTNTTRYNGMINGVNYTTDTVSPVIAEPRPFFESAINTADVAPGHDFAISFTVDASKIGGYGLQTDTVWLSTRQHPEQRCPIAMTAIVTDDFSHMSEAELEHAPILMCDRSFVDYGRIDTLSQTPVTAEVEVSNTGKTPLNIRRIYTLDSGLEFSGLKAGDKIKPGKSRILTIKVDPALLRGKELLNARLSIVSDSPTSSVYNIRVVGRLGDGTQNP